MVPHGTNVARQDFLVPLDPFIVIDVAFFTLAELAPMHNAAPAPFFHRNHDMQALVINDPRNCIQRTISSIVASADANQVEAFARHRIQTIKRILTRPHGCSR